MSDTTMTSSISSKRLGFFTRLLDEAPPAERYRLATEQIAHAERCGFDSAWIAQHHFHEAEGGYLFAACFIFLIAATMFALRRMRQVDVAAAAAGLLIATAAHGLVDIYWVRGTPVLGWLVVGMACGGFMKLRGERLTTA